MYMDYENILNELDNIYILILDNNNNIVFPKDINKQIYIKNIYNNYYTKENCYYYNKQCYKLNKKIINQNNNSYQLFCFENITNYKILEKRNEIDMLTTVFTRKAVLEKIDNFLTQNQNYFSIVMLDIDNFKTINDTYGHLTGDIVLNKIGKILNENLDNSLIGRYGGEEFIILQSNIELEQSKTEIEKVRLKIEKLVVDTGTDIIDNITVSCGIYNSNERYDKNISIDEFRKKLINYADVALYTSKHSGKNQTNIYQKSMN